MALEHLVDAQLQYQPGMTPLADVGEGVLVGSGDGTVAGPTLSGVFAGHCSSSQESSSAQ